MKTLFAIALVLVSVTAFAQSSLPAASTFSLQPSALMLPGGKSSFVGTDIGAKFGLTQNISLRSDNIVSTDASLQAYMGGFEYQIAALSRLLNNASPQLNGYKFAFYTGASAGLDRVAGNNHYAFAGRVGANYTPVGQTFTVNLGEFSYMRLPGYNNNALAVSLGFKINW